MLVVYITIIIDFLFGEVKTPPKIYKKNIFSKKNPNLKIIYVIKTI